MVWFNKKKKEVVEPERGLVKLPGLPKLPALPKLQEFNNSMPQLPALPKNSLGGERGERVFDETAFEKKEDTFQANQKPFKKFSNNIPPKENLPIKRIKEIVPPEAIKEEIKNAGPVFIRLDKFEESLRIFEKTREKISEVEKTLADTKRMKEKETKELESWEKEINLIKEQLENIDKNIFSRI